MLGSHDHDSTASRIESAVIESRTGWLQRTGSFKLVSDGYGPALELAIVPLTAD
ncbi:hypothetical protein SynNOUM97013_01245 [Synechococcus sp. NOUM97013]|nr:hypothetical protein SynNOUM97013_01245 [Synechococcus sp. NOUM97013]